ncbi:rCG63592 [Rattus norvegicus]|uniref:RCG63592 n=1 Tax=Rattus norvegicus TaxID=10116 RepID=A6I553_RAT|nr:rCG63592 [Rattus norvegicus]
MLQSLAAPDYRCLSSCTDPNSTTHSSALLHGSCFSHWFVQYTLTCQLYGGYYMHSDKARSS